MSKSPYVDIALIQRPCEKGLTKSEYMDLFDLLDDTQAYPLEIEGENAVAMGFITPRAAEELDYDYEMSGLNEFIRKILNDVNKESEDARYEFEELKIWLST